MVMSGHQLKAIEGRVKKLPVPTYLPSLWQDAANMLAYIRFLEEQLEVTKIEARRAQNLLELANRAQVSCGA